MLEQPIDNVVIEDRKEVEEYLTKKIKTLSDTEISKWFEESSREEEFIDPKISIITKVRALLQIWQELSAQLSRIREDYSLAKRFGDENIKKNAMERGRPILQRHKIIEEDLQTFLPMLKNVQFLRADEMILLPKWQLQLLGVRIDNYPIT